MPKCHLHASFWDLPCHRKAGGNHSQEERVASWTFEYSLCTFASTWHLVLWPMGPSSTCFRNGLTARKLNKEFFACKRCLGLVSSSSRNPSGLFMKLFARILLRAPNDVSVCHSHSLAKIWDGLENPLTLQKKAWGENIRRLRRVLPGSARAAKLFPMPIYTLGGWHPDAHREMGTIAINIASRTFSSLHYARATLFQRHAAPLVTNNAVSLMSGFDFEVSVIRLEIMHSTVAVWNIVVFYKSLLPVHTVKYRSQGVEIEHCDKARKLWGSHVNHKSPSKESPQQGIECILSSLFARAQKACILKIALRQQEKEHCCKRGIDSGKKHLPAH